MTQSDPQPLHMDPTLGDESPIPPPPPPSRPGIEEYIRRSREVPAQPHPNPTRGSATPPPEQVDGQAPELFPAVVDAVRGLEVELGQAPSGKQVRERVKGRNTAVAEALEHAVKAGALEVSEGPRGARLFRVCG